MEKLRVFTAFSGYDSQCLALNRLKENNPDFDYDLVGWSEIDKYAIQAHNALFPQWSDRNLGDISKIDWTGVPDFDLFTYSSPCQDFSTAGLQRGGEKGSGTRSSLLWECEKAIIAKRPKYCILENVKALVSKKFFDLFMSWCDTMNGYGYTNYWKVLNAKDYGVPQNRERVFLISVLDGGSFEFPQPMPLEKRLKDILERNVEGKYYLSDKMGMYIRADNGKWTGNNRESLVNKDIASTINTAEGTRRCDASNYVVDNAPENYDIKKDPLNILGSTDEGCRSAKIEAMIEAGKIPNEEVYIDAYNQRTHKDYTACIQAGCRSLDWVKVKEPLICRQVGRNPENPTCRKSGIPTKQMIEIGGGVSHCLSTVQKDNMVVGTNYRIRKLTPTECFRLMGVSDKDIQTIRTSGVSNSQQYKMAGNSIVVDVLYYIFDSLLFHTKTSGEQEQNESAHIVKIGNYHKSNHNASVIVDPQGIAPTVMENHGTVTAIKEAGRLDTKYEIDGRVFDTAGISPTLRSIGHTPLIEESIEKKQENMDKKKYHLRFKLNITI